MTLTKWNELKGKDPGYRDQEESVTKYDFEKCEFLQRERGNSYDGVCNGVRNINEDEECLDCPYFIGNMTPKKYIEEMNNKKVIEETAIMEGVNIVDAIRKGTGIEEKNNESLEDEIFTRIYGTKNYDLEEGIHMLKRVIGRLENSRKQNAKEALEAFLNNYCGDGKCSKCSFACINDCLIKMQIGFLERGEE